MITGEQFYVIEKESYDNMELSPLQNELKEKLYEAHHDCDTHAHLLP